MMMTCFPNFSPTHKKTNYQLSIDKMSLWNPRNWVLKYSFGNSDQEEPYKKSMVLWLHHPFPRPNWEGFPGACGEKRDPKVDIRLSQYCRMLPGRLGSYLMKISGGNLWNTINGDQIKLEKEGRVSATSTQTMADCVPVYRGAWTEIPTGSSFHLKRQAGGLI